jgi:hypothetical protein
MREAVKVKLGLGSGVIGVSVSISISCGYFRWVVEVDFCYGTLLKFM